MRLFSQKAFLLVLVSSIGCDSTTAPPSVSGYFVLQTINSRALPTFLAATPGNTATIVSSTLTLNTAGKAVVTEHRQDIFQGDGTYSTTLDYRIHGTQIEIGSFSPCPINALCAANWIGTFTPGGLSLSINPASVDFQIVYEYRAFGAD